MTGCRAGKCTSLLGSSPYRMMPARVMSCRHSGWRSCAAELAQCTVPTGQPSARSRSTTCANSVVLLVGVALVVGLDAVRHRKVLKDAADVQPGQGVESLQLADGLRKAGTHRKADAAHAGVDLQVDLNLDARLDGGSGERLCVFGRIAGGDQAVGSQHSRIGGVGVAQNQDGCCDAAAAQVPPLAKGTDREARSTGFLQNAGDDVIAVAVGVRLDDGADRPADRVRRMYS